MQYREDLFLFNKHLPSTLFINQCSKMLYSIQRCSTNINTSNVMGILFLIYGGLTFAILVLPQEFLQLEKIGSYQQREKMSPHLNRHCHKTVIFLIYFPKLS